jgi:hypothetical protein
MICALDQPPTHSYPKTLRPATFTHRDATPSTASRGLSDKLLVCDERCLVAIRRHFRLG